MFRIIQIGLFLSVLLTSNSLSALDRVEYDLDFKDASRHRVHITVKVKTDGKEELEFFMPVWTPGSYLVREYARNIETIYAQSPGGRSLRMVKLSKNRWKVSCKQESEVWLKYQLYCHEMSVRTNWVEKDFAILNGAATFITLVGAEKKKHYAYLKMPKEWKQSVSALTRNTNKGQHVHAAKNFDELVDNPILLGNPEVERFEEKDVFHFFVHHGGHPFWKAKDSVEDVRKIVREHQRFWGSVPYSKYYFLNLVNESRGGLEHDNCTLLMTSRWNFKNRKNYIGWMALVSHEFFHTWNVRRLRPKELTEYDYEKENYFKTLWIAEGITSYYDDLALVRAEVCSEAEYLELLSKNIKSVQSSPSRNVQSLADSSHDTWIKFYRPNENTVNQTVNYYSKGAVAAFVLDAKIRELTSGKRSLDSVMRLLYERHLKDGYSPEDFRKIVKEVSGQDLNKWFAKFIDGTEEFDYDSALKWFGLKFKSSTLAPVKPDKKAKPTKKKVWLGLSTSTDSGRIKVTRVLLKSPAFQAGLNVDDEIIAIDGFRIPTSGLTSRMEQYKPGDTVELLISRREKLMKLKVLLVEASPHTWTLQFDPKATEVQKMRRLGWLRVREEF